jgi:hypothetical protein
MEVPSVRKVQTLLFMASIKNQEESIFEGGVLMDEVTGGFPGPSGQQLSGSSTCQEDGDSDTGTDVFIKVCNITSAENHYGFITSRRAKCLFDNEHSIPLSRRADFRNTLDSNIPNKARLKIYFGPTDLSSNRCLAGVGVITPVSTTWIALKRFTSKFRKFADMGRAQLYYLYITQNSFFIVACRRVLSRCYCSTD